MILIIFILSLIQFCRYHLKNFTPIEDFDFIIIIELFYKSFTFILIVMLSFIKFLNYSALFPMGLGYQIIFFIKFDYFEHLYLLYFNFRQVIKDFYLEVNSFRLTQPLNKLFFPPENFFYFRLKLWLLFLKQF